MKTWRPWKLTSWPRTLAALCSALLVNIYVFHYALSWPDDFNSFLATVAAFYAFDFLLTATAELSKKSPKN